MHRVIYADTLIFLNSIITFIILLTVRRCSDVRTSDARMAAASFIGGIFSLAIFAPEMRLSVSLLLKLLICLVIVLTAFYIKDRRKFLRCLAMFILITFLYGGVMYFIAGLFKNEFVFYKNGFGYIGFDFLQLILICAVVYCVIVFIRKKTVRAEKEVYYDIELHRGGRTVTGTALLDTGDFVTDCYTGKPVIIAEAPLVLPMLDASEAEELRSFYHSRIPEGENRLKLRLLPVRTVSGGRMLPAFTCDCAVIRNEARYYSVRAPSVAVVFEDFGKADCDAIINEKVFL